MKLRQLINALGTQVAVSGSLDTDISGLAYDSRKVEPGFAFIAIPGENFDGHDFVPKALEAGAAAIICQRPLATGDKPCVVVPDCRQALADLSAEFYGHPDRKLRLIGVTGTNGKTTTTYLVKWLLESAGHRAGLVGTIKNLAGDRELPASRTTPEALHLSSERYRMLWKAIGTLKPEDRELVTLRYFSELSLREIARMMNKSYPAVSQKLHRLHLNLKQWMEENGYDF